MTAPTWDELLDRIAAVEFSTAVGRIAWRDIDDDGVATERSSAFWFAPEQGLRLDDDVGIRFLTSDDVHLVRDDRGHMQRLAGPVGHAGPDDPRRMLGGPAVANDLRNSNGFHTPEHPPEQTTVGGRPGWRVTLAPPPHKPYPMQIVVDDATGTMLEQRPLGTDAWVRLVDVEFDVELPEDVFTPAEPIATDLAESATRPPIIHEHLGEHPWPTPRYWPSGLDIEVLDADLETGMFVGVLQRGPAVMARWPLGEQPPARADDAMAVLHQYRWSDEHHDWLLAVESPLAPDDVRRIVESIPAADD